MDKQSTAKLQQECQQLRERVAELEAAQLTHNQTMLQLVIDSLPGAVFWKDHNLIYQGCNQTFATYAGVGTPADIIGKSDYDLPWKPEEAEAYRQYDQQVMERGTPAYHIVETQQHADGTRIWADTNKIPLRDKSGAVIGILGTYEDITRRKQQEQELYLFKALADNALDGIGFATSAGIIQYVNQSYKEMTGFGERAIGSNVMDYYAPESIETAQQEVAPAVEREGYWQGTLRLQRPDKTVWDGQGSVFAVKGERGDVIGMASIIRDITAQKQQEEALQVFKTMADTAPDGFGMADQYGVLTYANKAYREMTGYGDELIGMRFIDHFSAEEQPRAIEAITETSTIGEWRGLLHFQRKDGSQRPIDCTGFVTRDEQGNITAVMGLFRDMTERLRQEETLQLTHAALDNAADAIGWYDRTGKVLYFNQAAYTLYGYTVDDLDWLYARHIDPQFTAESIGRLIDRLKQHGAILIEREHRHRDGSVIPVEATNSYIAFNNKEYICVVIRDIRDRKRQEAEREALQQQIIDAQRNALRELSTPLIPISDTVVIMPLIGTIDSGRAQQVMETLLEGVAQHRASLVILDITGVSVVDTQVAQAFIQAAQAVRLLGAQVMLTGIQPQIAQTLVQLGVDLSDIITRGSLQAGIAAALRQ